MNKTQLYEAMSFIDDKYIAESMTPYKKKIPRWLKSAVGTAACLIIAVGIALFPYLRPKNDANDIGGNMEPAPNAPDASGKFTAIDVTLLSWDFAVQVRSFIAILYLIAGVMLFVGLGLIYNLNKK